MCKWPIISSAYWIKYPLSNHYEISRGEFLQKENHWIKVFFLKIHEDSVSVYKEAVLFLVEVIYKICLV